MNSSFYNEKGKFLHNVMGKYLIEKFKIVRFEINDDEEGKKENNLLYIYHNGVYINNIEIIQTEMINLIDDLTERSRKEVLSYLKLRTKIVKEDCNIIALKNGFFNEKTFEFYPLTEENKYKYRTTRKINHNYNENAKSELLDETLNGIFLGSQELRDLFYEMIGYCMHYTCEFEKMFILKGEGANGKSTLFNLIYALFGTNNYTANSLQDLTINRFRLAGLNNKMLNIDDDTESGYLAESSTTKKLVSGGIFEAEKKGVDSFNFRNRAKLLFSCNNQTRFGDTSNGLNRRLIFIPLEADFLNSGDITLGQRLANESVYEALLLNSILGLKRLIKNQKFTTTKKIEQALADYIYSNNPILQFMDETYGDSVFNELSYEERICQNVYDNYRHFCLNKGYKNPVSINTFGSELKRLGYDRDRLGINVKSKLQGTTYKRPYIYVEMPKGNIKNLKEIEKEEK